MSAFDYMRLNEETYNYNPATEAKSTDIGSSDRRNPLTGKLYSHRYYALYKKRIQLPVFKFRDEFMQLLAKRQCIVLTGETGSGKTTQIPQWCLEYVMSQYGEERKVVVCTQPRRMAALAIAKRVSEEMDVSLGEQVGYSFRFENCTSYDTVLKYTTDGTLLRECTFDSVLTNYQVVIIDEAHERTQATDILLGALKGIIKQRRDIKVVIMSATLDASKFQQYFGITTLMSVPGRTYPVEIIYSQLSSNYFDEAIRIVLKIHRREKIAGDILLFLTGQDEIERACERIEAEVYKLGNSVGQLECIPLYGTQPPEEQQRIYEPAPRNRVNGEIGRKVIVSTNIAETSLTVDGVVFVVDSGYAKQKVFNPRNRVESILNSLISKAAAQQRAGRAGRTGPGKCYRLYSEQKYENKMPNHTVPEILRSNFSSVILQMKKLGFNDLKNFDFIDPPPQDIITRAVELVTDLGAVDAYGKLTDMGEIISEFPLEPQMAKMLITSCLRYDCTEEILTIVAMLSTGQSCFTRSKKFKVSADAARKELTIDGDHITLLNVYNKFKLNYEDAGWCKNHFLNYRVLTNGEKVRQQLSTIIDKLGLPRKTTDPKSCEYNNNIKKALLSGFFMQVAVHVKRFTYHTVKENQEVLLHPSCSYTFLDKPEWVFYNELVLTSKNYIRVTTGINPEWLLEVAPKYYALNNLPQGRAKREIEILQACKRLKGLSC